MSSLRFTNPAIWAQIEGHLSDTTRERFAFGLTNLVSSGTAAPVLEVIDVVLVPDHDVDEEPGGWAISDTALDGIHNQAASAGQGLIELHNHRKGPPRFSCTDEKALALMAPYMVDLLSMPYGAAVWAEGSLYAEWWRTAGEGLERGEFATALVFGNRLRVLNAQPVRDERFDRQLALLGPRGQDAISALRVAVVGGGGTGSHVAVQLAHLGFIDILILDDDVVEDTNLNRQVTAAYADLGAPKSLVAKRRVQSINPFAKVKALPGITPDGEHHELYEVDLIIGCVDHDGPRHRLNQIAIDTRTPYLDIATGVDDTAGSVAIGGRVILLRPGRPCLTCLGELDSAEVGRWSKPAEQEGLDRIHGYGTGVPNPSVVYLNGLTVSAALGELVAWLSGARPPAEWLDIDLVGQSGRPGAYVGPLEIGEVRTDCIDCARPAATVG